MHLKEKKKIPSLIRQHGKIKFNYRDQKKREQELEVGLAHDKGAFEVSVSETEV